MKASIWIVLEAGAEQGIPVVLNDEVMQLIGRLKSRNIIGKISLIG